jgi:preprotein translocase subunit YajC
MTGFAYAQAAPGAFDMFGSLLVPTVLIIGIMYFLMIRPQQNNDGSRNTETWSLPSAAAIPS